MVNPSTDEKTYVCFGCGQPVDRRVDCVCGEHRQRLLMRCGCGETFVLHGDEDCPKCGQWYNLTGQKLAPPSQWGEETGERFDDRGNYIGGGDEDGGFFDYD